MPSSIPILVYHSIAPFELSGVWLSRRRFEKQIKWLFENGFKTIKTEECVGVQSPYKKSVLLTFDDGYDNFYQDGLPVLLRYGFTATLFVVSSYVGKSNSWDAGISRLTHMGWAELRELSSLGFEIASHTHTHPDLTRLSPKEVRRELEFSKKMIEDKIGSPANYLSYSFGRHSKPVREIAKDIYTACFCSNPFSQDRWAMGRMGVYVIDTMGQYKLKLFPERDGAFYLLEGVKNNAINFVARGTPLWNSAKKALCKNKTAEDAENAERDKI